MKALNVLRWVLIVWMFLLMLGAAADGDWTQAVFFLLIYVFILREPADA